jgi:tRNA G18 (ribose-2'-O)-methylase SpoU
VGRDVWELRQVGAAHPDIRRALALRAGREPGQLLIDGIWAHQAAVDAGVGFDSFFCTPELLREPTGPALAGTVSDRARTAYRVSDKIIHRLSERDRVDGMASIVELPRWRSHDVAVGPDPLIVVADGLQSPGNLGTVLRTMDACGAQPLIMTSLRTRADTAKVFQGSRGRSLTVPHLVMDEPTQAIRWLRDRRISVLVADANAGTPYPAADLRHGTAIVLGNERYGASAAWEMFPKIRIPMLGRADSLNVAVSAGVLLYHARAQRDGW